MHALQLAERGSDESLAIGPRWSVDSEYGVLTDVMLCAPTHLSLVPCCSVSVANLRDGATCSIDRARFQHRALAAIYADLGVRCHFLPPAPGFPDLTFARDAALVTPWGRVALAPAAAHRRGEATLASDYLRSLGVPDLGSVEEGHVEGGDVCLLRRGTVLIGCSGVRTDEAGAASLARIFERRGWQAIIHRFDPHFLHLDTQFTMLDRHHALACADVLDDAFLEQIEALGITIIPTSYKEVQRLANNVVSLGNRRILSTAGNDRINNILVGRGYDVTAVDLSEFTQCGGGVHCLTLPLARLPG